MHPSCHVGCTTTSCATCSAASTNTPPLAHAPPEVRSGKVTTKVHNLVLQYLPPKLQPMCDRLKTKDLFNLVWAVPQE